MVKWVYIDDKNNTPAFEIKKMAGKLMTASMKSKVNLEISFRIKHKEPHKPCLDITFYGEDTFFMNMYCFYPIEKNQKIMDLAKMLIKDSSKFQQIKEQYREVDRW